MKNNSISIKSNISLKSKELNPPIDNMPNKFFDVRLDSALTEAQKKLKTKMMYWANRVTNENGTNVEDNCYKNCENCGEKNNNCKRFQNKNNCT